MIRNTKARPAQPERAAAEYYFALADRIRGLRDADGGVLQTLGITSCLPGEGVSTVALNLAAAAGDTYQSPVLVIEANLHRPKFEASLDLTEEPGLADFLVGAIDTADTVRATNVPNVSVMSAGTPSSRVRANCDPSRIQGMFNALKADFALIVVDLPAALSASMCWNVAPVLDGLMLVVEADRVESEAASRVKRRLTEAGANLVGVVLNKQPMSARGAR